MVHQTENVRYERCYREIADLLAQYEARDAGHETTDGRICY